MRLADDVGNRATGHLPSLDADAVMTSLGWSEAVDALERALFDGLDPAAAAERTIVPVSHGQLLLMPAETSSALGVKLATVTPDNPGLGLPRIQAQYLLLDRQTHRVTALMDGTALTTLRTAAVSAVAVKHLAVAESRHLVVFGTGPQAWGHVQALRTVRPLESVTVVGRDHGRSSRLAHLLTDDGLLSQVGSPADVAKADIVVCATTAATPLFDGRLLTSEACVVAVGSHEPHLREVDSEVVRRAAAGGGVVVETGLVAIREAGDIVLAVQDGACTPDDLVGIDNLVRRDIRPSGVSLFKSCGMGWQDLVVAEAVLAGWRARYA